MNMMVLAERGGRPVELGEMNRRREEWSEQAISFGVATWASPAACLNLARNATKSWREACAAETGQTRGAPTGKPWRAKLQQSV
jgi:hypothetical protein